MHDTLSWRTAAHQRRHWRLQAASPDCSVALLTFLVVAVLARWQTFGDPVVGYDEQFYLLVGDRMWNHHALPYVDIWDRKPIGLFLIYAFARMLGGAGFLQYKLVALGFVLTTAMVVYRIAREAGFRFGGIVAGALYICWLNFVEGEGGQADVLLAPFVAAAGWITWRARPGAAGLPARGALAMLLIGVAMQIKYTAMFEGVYFAFALLAKFHRGEVRMARLAAMGVLWGGCAALPTVVVSLYYVAIGHWPEFVFANFLSQFGRNPLPAGLEAKNYAFILGIFMPLMALVWVSRRRGGAHFGFCLGWLAISLGGMLLVGNVGSTHYATPALIPAVLAGAGAWGEGARRRWPALAFVAVGFALSQLVLERVIYLKGGAAAAAAVAAAARPGKGCIYVYNGYPALYMLTHSCLPTRWAFPGHLNFSAEASIHAIGVDPVAEEARILASEPAAIVDDYPVNGGNPANHALLEAALRRHYTLVARVANGAGRFRLVYRRRPGP